MLVLGAKRCAELRLLVWIVSCVRLALKCRIVSGFLSNDIDLQWLSMWYTPSSVRWCQYLGLLILHGDVRDVLKQGGGDWLNKWFGSVFALAVHEVVSFQLN